MVLVFIRYRQRALPPIVYTKPRRYRMEAEADLFDSESSVKSWKPLMNQSFRTFRQQRDGGYCPGRDKRQVRARGEERQAY